MELDKFTDEEFFALARQNTDGFIEDMTESEIYDVLSRQSLLGGTIAVKAFATTLDT